LRLPDGGVLAHIVDVSELVARKKPSRRRAAMPNKLVNGWPLRSMHCPQDSSCTTPRIG